MYMQYVIEINQVSITFDPFMVLPVPLPTNQKCVQVVFFYYEPSKRPIKVSCNQLLLIIMFSNFKRTVIVLLFSSLTLY